MGTFKIDIQKNNGNLYLRPSGDFDGSSAWTLINLLKTRYTGQGQVVIDTRHLRKIHPFGCDTFHCQLKQLQLPASRLAFTGEKGYALAPTGSRVVLPPPKETCQCGRKKPGH